jgi:hypothetical protein
LGDSYAVGLGDEYFHQIHRSRAHYGSAARLFQLTGRDVQVLASSGTGSIESMVSQPLALLDFYRAHSRLSLMDPQQFVVYFYEGNDLNENVEYLKQASKKRQVFDYSQLDNSDYFQQYIRQVALERDPLYQKARSLSWRDQLYLAQYVRRSLPLLLTRLRQKLQLFLHPTEKGQNPVPEAGNTPQARSPLNPPGRYEWQEPGYSNKAVIGQEPFQLPDKLQGPSMDLDTKEMELALTSYQEALRFLRHRFPETPITVVYIPSVISIYSVRSPQVSLQSHADRNLFLFAYADVLQQSNWIYSRIADISQELDVQVIDSRAALREAALAEPLHGPLDWNHFNARGYEVLAKSIAAQLTPPPGATPPRSARP